MKKLKTKYFLVFIELYPSGSKNQFAFNPEAFSFFKPAARKEHIITYKNNDYCTSFFLHKLGNLNLLINFTNIVAFLKLLCIFMMVGHSERIVFIKDCNEIHSFTRCNILSY